MLQLIPIWRALTADELDEATLAPLLEEAVEADREREWADKLPFAGLLVRAARHPSARLRRLAVKLLWGAHGFRAKEVLVEALRDEDAGVRGAAAESCAEETGLLTIATKRDHASRPQPYLQLAVSSHPEVRGRALTEGRDSGCDARIQEWLEQDEAARRAAETLRRSGGGLSRTVRSERDEKIAMSLRCVPDEDLPRFLRHLVEIARADRINGFCTPILERKTRPRSTEACALALASKGERGDSVLEVVLRHGSLAPRRLRESGPLSDEEAAFLAESFASAPRPSLLLNAYLRSEPEHSTLLRQQLRELSRDEILLLAFTAGPVGIPLLTALAESGSALRLPGPRPRIRHETAASVLDCLFSPPGMVAELGQEAREGFQAVGAVVAREHLDGTPLFETARAFFGHLPKGARLAMGGEAAARAKPAGKPFTDLLRARIRKAASWNEAEARLFEGACFHPGLDASEISAAAARLVEAGAEERVLQALVSTPAPPNVAALCATVGRWTSADTLRAAKAVVGTGTLEGAVRFRLAKALVERGDEIPIETFLRAIREPSEGSEAGWLDPADLQFLRHRGLDRRQVAAAMLCSPDAEHRGRAVAILLGSRSVAAEALDLLRRFVENADAVSDARAARAASRRLLANGDGTGIPFLLGEVRRGHGSRSRVSPVRLLRQAAADGEARSLGAAIGANGAGSPFLDRFRGGTASGINARTRNAVLLELLRDTESHGPRDTRADELAGLMTFEPGRDPTVERLVSCFAWGVRQARRLTGREISIHLATGGAFGYTTPGDSRVFVSPMPILRPVHDDATPSTALDPEGEPYGDVLVKAIILHEIGHHLYGADEASRAVAAEAARLGIGAILNLVEDVYLERSMRREEPAFGRAFDLLTAWAFQRAKCDIPVEVLFEQFGERTMAVLSKVGLGRAREVSSVRLVGGRLLHEMERSGSSWARFFRALRLGKGDRHDDAKVREGLGLFEKTSFRKSTPEDCLRIAKRLAELFGSDATGLFGAWGPPFGPTPETELKVAAGSISDAAIQEGVARRLGEGAGGKKGGRGREAPEMARLWLNLDPEERFEKISHVEFVPRSAERERAAARVARPFSRRLRLELEELDLGSRLEPRTRRLRGRLGRVGLSAALARRDPRLLVARERRPARDLFLGLLVDCSGSMGCEGSIERARLFAALFCEAARGLPGIETRILGFNDRLHDAGTADRSAAQSLVPSGSNNDAGALWNLGLRALESGRTAKAIVVVSDGMPVLCSVAALGAVARALEARGVACVQVAVRPLEATPFRDHVLLETPDPAEAARKFAGVLSRVIRRALER